MEREGLMNVTSISPSAQTLKTAIIIALFWSFTPGLAGARETSRAIRQARAASNAAIAVHDASGAVGAFASDAVVIGSGGKVLQGREAMEAAFKRAFDQEGFITYVRRSSRIEMSKRVAAEHGHWRGVWKDQLIQGVYLARWEKTDRGWQIFNEVYVPLSCSGVACGRLAAR